MPLVGAGNGYRSGGGLALFPPSGRAPAGPSARDPGPPGRRIQEDELVAVTPKSMRLRKIILNEIERKRKSSDFSC